MAKKKLPKEVVLVREHTLPETLGKTERSISYSQFSQFSTCNYQWYLNYPSGYKVYSPTIHTVFGTALHETIQEWLNVLYNQSVKKASETDLSLFLFNRLREIYKQERALKGEDFTTPKELQEFWQDGVEILQYLKRKRSQYFPTKGTYLVGVEIPILQKLLPNLHFKGFIDLLFYNSTVDKYLIIDIKTSTRGWTKHQKQDETKLSQLILYKEFLSRQFSIDIDKIDTQYFIVKRKILIDPEFASMARRVQEFSPPSGKVKRGKILTQIDKFVKEGFTDQGEYRQRTYVPSPSKHSCMFCPFKERKDLCNASIF